MPRRYGRLLLLPLLLALAGTAVLVFEGLTSDVDVLAVVLGAVLVLAAIQLTNLIVIWNTREPADVMFRDGYSQGWEAGHAAGEAQGHRVVVPLIGLAGNRTGREAS